MHILWPGPGPGSGLFLVIGQPDAIVPMSRMEHPSPSGTYDGRDAARNAVHAFIAADGGERPPG